MSESAAVDEPMSTRVAHSPGTIRRLTVLTMGVALGMLALGAAMLFDARRDALWQAQQAAANLALALERDIARNVATYDLSLRGAVEALQEPGIDQVTPAIRHAAVFDRAASAEYLGSLLVLDANGDIAADSTSVAPHKLNLADRDYFQIHQKQPDAGLFVSRPFRSRLRKQDTSIAISRRVSGPDGRFGGVVVGTLRLAYFQGLFDRLDVGSTGMVSLFRADGRLVARSPFREDDFDRDASSAANFRRFATAMSGQFVGYAAHDGIERLYSFRHVGSLPLILAVAVSTEDVYAAWWRKAIVIGPVLAALCGATVTSCLLFRREMLRRMLAEDALVEAAEKLSLLAATDALTGLANRRAFDAAMPREWRRAIRGNTPIALLMLDADCFKSYNDHYGHQEGDRVLQGIASCIRQNISRPSDQDARYGGEEFIVLLPETELPGALHVAELIRSAVAKLDIAHIKSPTGRVTASIGVAVAYPQFGDAASSLVKDADAALYDAKHLGRNCVSVGGRNYLPVVTRTAVPLDQAGRSA